MEREKILLIVKKALSEVSAKSSDDIFEKTSFIKDLCLESIDIVDFNFLVDQAFKKRIDLFDLFQFSQLSSEENYFDPTVQDVVNFLEKELNKKD